MIYMMVYSSSRGRFAAIHLPWQEVEAILGRPHEGRPEDDGRLVEALLVAGAPEWVRDAEGWADESGWGLIGPALPEAGG